MYQVVLLDKTSKEHVDQCLDLLLTSFQGKLDYFKWKHNLDGRYSIEEYTFCVFKDLLCIATTQVIVHEMMILGKTHRFGLLCDGATHSDYRRLGLFEKLLSHINQFGTDKNIDFVYSTGNEKSRKALLKLGFEDFFTTLKASKRIRFNHPLLKIYNLMLNVFGNLGLQKFDDIKPVSIVDYSQFSDNYVNDIEISFNKDVEYLKWRLDETTGIYKAYGIFNEADEIIGVIVLKTMHNLMYIVDLLASKTKDVDRLLKFATSLATRNKTIKKINSSHNNFKAYKKSLVSNRYKLSAEGSNTLIYILNTDFKLANLHLDKMHYMRIDKNE